jgi:hypothetical protein
MRFVSSNRNNCQQTEPPVEGVIRGFDHEAYRRDLRKMSDVELIDETQSHRRVVGLLVLLEPWLLSKLDDCRAEWHRRRPQLQNIGH